MAWACVVVLLLWAGSAYAGYRLFLARTAAIQAARDAALVFADEAQAACDVACGRLDVTTQALAALRADHDQSLKAWADDVARCRADFASDAQASREEVKHLRAHLAQSADQVTALTKAKVLADAAIQARLDWAQAFNRNFSASRDIDPTPAKGWQCVIVDAEGKTTSVRKVRDGNIPTRISRAHGDRADWFRLMRVDGLSLIYEPELDPGS